MNEAAKPLSLTGLYRVVVDLMRDFVNKNNRSPNTLLLPSHYARSPEYKDAKSFCGLNIYFCSGITEPVVALL